LSVLTNLQLNTPSTETQRTRVLGNIAKILADSFGLTASQQMMNKLVRQFEGLGLPALIDTINELENLPFYHPKWRILVDILTVHETYFFRDMHQLTMLHKVLLPCLIQQAAKQCSPQLRIWSAGCSTGEEVYSVAMLLLDALLQAGYAFGSVQGGIHLMPGWDVQIIGTDISEITLDKAKQAQYANFFMGSFRSMEQRWHPWFDELPELNVHGQPLLCPKEFVRKITTFKWQNIKEQSAGMPTYDLILCRNVLIYFDDHNKKIIQQNFINTLKDGGMLILGAADPWFNQQGIDISWQDGLVYYLRH
jgi:chemotaxis protein methyltransferase CheR